MKEYRGFKFECQSSEAEARLTSWIDGLGDEPSELLDVSDEAYENWSCDYDFDGVKKLVLPAAIKRIGKCVFAQSRIKELVADGVLAVDELAFYNTKELEKVSLKSCKVLLSTDAETGEFTDGSDAFNHSHVSELILPSVERVGRYAFYDMPNVAFLSLPSAVSIQPYAIYGNESLRHVGLGALKTAQFATISSCPQLERVDLDGLAERHVAAFYLNNPAAKFFAPDCQTFDAQPEEPLEWNREVLKESRRREEIAYDFEYRGFKVGLAIGLGQQERGQAEKLVCQGIDEMLSPSGQNILNSPNAGTNESGHAAFGLIKSIYIPKSVKQIGDYAFSKSYALESVVADGVEVVGDHAFYCDEGLRYVDLPAAKVLKNDAFNGAGYALTQVPASKQMAKLFLPSVEAVGKHAFWQTGFRVVEMPKAEMVMPSAFEENGVLQRLQLAANSEQNVAIMNPQLRELCVKNSRNKSQKCVGSPYLGKTLVADDEPTDND